MSGRWTCLCYKAVNPAHLDHCAGCGMEKPMMLDPLRWPKHYATLHHGAQLYAGTLPYTHHLAAVEAVLRRFLSEGILT